MSMLADLFERIGRELGEDEVIYLEAVQHETPLFDLLDGAARPAGFHAVQYGNFYRHRFAAIPGSYEAYLAQLGGRTRADLRTNRKRFVASVGQSYRTRRFCAPEEVPAFLPDAMDLSRKTYQYQLLGGGLRERATLEHRYLAAARLGWFRSYLLYVNDQPVAFQVGYVYRGRFLAAEIGYDPQWARHHVGIFLHTEIIADLAVDEAITEFDFDNDDGVHKERLSTRSTLEGYFYLIPARGMGGVMALSMRLTNRVSAALGTVLGRLGIRAKVRALLRKAGVAK
jgi:hypothetical protein